MSRIDTVVVTSATVEWIQKNQEQVKTHPAWYHHTSKNEAEAFLKDQKPLTYLLRFGDREHSYFISFVDKEGAIKHQDFVLELDRKGWLYKNGFTDGLLEAVARDVADLIPLMMHCDFNACIPFGKRP